MHASDFEVATWAYVSAYPFLQRGLFLSHFLGDFCHWLAGKVSLYSAAYIAYFNCLRNS